MGESKKRKEMGKCTKGSRANSNQVELTLSRMKEATISTKPVTKCTPAIPTWSIIGFLMRQNRPYIKMHTAAFCLFITGPSNPTRPHHKNKTQARVPAYIHIQGAKPDNPVSVIRNPAVINTGDAIVQYLKILNPKS